MLKNAIQFIAIATIATSAASLPLSAKQNAAKTCDKLPMSTYIWHGCMTDSDFVDRINYANFDIVYLMDQQGWLSQEDFDATIDSIVATDGATVRLSKPERFRQAVRKAHDEGAIAMISTGNDMIFGALDDVRTDKMCRALANTVRDLDLDGIDLDWEIGIYSYMDRHANLLSTMRSTLDSLGKVTGKNYLVSTALSIEAQYPDSLREELRNAVDHINLMAYDIGGCLWRDNATHNTPLDLIKSCIQKNWYDIPRNKLHLGLASYGFMYNGIFPGEKVPDGKTVGDYGHYVNYLDMLPHTFGSHAWRSEYDPDASMFYYFDDDSHSFITIETPETLNKKFDFASEAGLGGTFWWEYAKDIIPDNNGAYKWRHILIPDHKQTGLKKQLGKRKNK